VAENNRNYSQPFQNIKHGISQLRHPSPLFTDEPVKTILRHILGKSSIIYHHQSIEYTKLHRVGAIGKIAIKARLQAIDGLNNEFSPHI
jgi:hypothetical protein